mmetsp:Transcript_65420/g.188200  ORF Transcript_65420/g.188200 Transcript_65420/m.188200 type:complete len:203 (+) Transcript_65420:1257-1865(+)
MQKQPLQATPPLTAESPIANGEHRCSEEWASCESPRGRACQQGPTLDRQRDTQGRAAVAQARPEALQAGLSELLLVASGTKARVAEGGRRAPPTSGVCMAPQLVQLVVGRLVVRGLLLTDARQWCRRRAHQFEDASATGCKLLGRAQPTRGRLGVQPIRTARRGGDWRAEALELALRLQLRRRRARPAGRRLRLRRRRQAAR